MTENFEIDPVEAAESREDAEALAAEIASLPRLAKDLQEGDYVLVWAKVLDANFRGGSHVVTIEANDGNLTGSVLYDSFVVPADADAKPEWALSCMSIYQASAPEEDMRLVLCHRHRGHSGQHRHDFIDGKQASWSASGQYGEITS